MRIEVKADVAQALRANRNKQRAVNRAAVRALNRTADQVRSAGAKSIAQELGLKQKTVRERLRVIRARRGDLRSVVVATGEQLGLIHFKARQVAAGVTVMLRGKRELKKGAFIATMPGGHRGVFRRRTRKRLPIREMWGPGIPFTMAEQHIFSALERLARKRWAVNFASDLRFYLGRA
jgi:hypothetical protein